MKAIRNSFAKPGPGWVGIAVDAHRIRMAQVQWDGSSRPRVIRLLERLRGDDLDADLRRLKKEAGLGRLPCIALLPRGEYQTMLVDAPEVPRKELAEALRWRIKDLLGMSPEKAAMDALLLPQVQGLGLRQQQAFVVSTEMTVVEKLAAPLVTAGLKLAAVDVPELAQRNLAAFCEDENRGLAFLNLEGDGGLLTLNWGGEMFASRRIEAGSDLWAGSASENRETAFERIALEVQRSMDYFDRQFSFISVSRLVLAGGGDLSAFAEYLRHNLYVPLELFDPAKVFDLQPGVDTVPAEFLPVLGLALRCEERAS